MSKELQGYTNHLIQNPDGSITKLFVDEGITSRPASIRMQAEIASLGKLPITPRLLRVNSGSVTMSALDGERNLDVKVDQMTDVLQFSVFESAGKTLKFIHDKYRRALPEGYFEAMIAGTIDKTRQIEPILQKIDIKLSELNRYFAFGCSARSLEKSGMTLVHGDFWLNNIIGKANHTVFTLTGVIDWEMSHLESPYLDLASVALSIISYHPFAGESFWKGYSEKPNLSLIEYFCVRQIVTWLSEDKNPNLASSFYADKIKMLKRII